MKHYAAAPNASIHMAPDPVLRDLVRTLAINIPLDVVIETGTYDGTGSTTFLAEALASSRLPAAFHTIEVNYERAMKARENLQIFSWVIPYWGASVPIAKAILWMLQDDVLANQAAHDVWVDHLEDPVTHYAREIAAPPWNSQRWAGEDLLRRLLTVHAGQMPLVVLDSAGGIGLMEFEILRETMGARQYFLLLDDIEHIKHARSMQRIAADPAFFVMGRGEKWALAVHNPR